MLGMLISKLAIIKRIIHQVKIEDEIMKLPQVQHYDNMYYIVSH